MVTCKPHPQRIAPREWSLHTQTARVSFRHHLNPVAPLCITCHHYILSTGLT